jgi:hypothetical protein
LDTATFLRWFAFDDAHEEQIGHFTSILRDVVDDETTTE